MNENQNININLNLPPNIISILNNVSRQLDTIAAATNNTQSAFTRLGAAAGTFNNINRALATLSATMLRAKSRMAEYLAVKILLTRQTGLLTAGTIMSQRAATRQSAILAAQAVIYGVLTKQIGAVTAAQILWNIAQQASPIGAKVAAISAAIVAITGLAAAAVRLARRLFRVREEATACGKTFADLSEEFGRSTEQIQDDMRDMGGATIDEWYAMEKGIRSLADQFGISVDQMREKAIAMGGDYELLGERLAGLSDVADDLGISFNEMADALERQGVPMANLVQMTPELAGVQPPNPYPKCRKGLRHFG